jgi:hypothetical protein
VATTPHAADEDQVKIGQRDVAVLPIPNGAERQDRIESGVRVHA